MAALGRLEDGVVADIRLAMGSVAPVPLRLIETEQVVRGRRIEPTLLRLARMAVASEIRPIDDMRSTARYRAAVAANLVEEFLAQLSVGAKNE
jgi:xanthine dehydrogenase iron-sulfur cluster and FAD-binding subunit A